MGLSNEERSDGLYACLVGMTREAMKIDLSGYEFKDEDRPFLARLKEICSPQHAWHTFLHDETNSLHWFLGSDSGNVVKWDSIGIWSTAVRNHVDDWHRRHKNNNFIYLDDDKDDNFNAFKNHLSVGGLLKSWNDAAASVLRIFQYAESISYYLRRYRDEFLKERDSLNRMLSEIYGLCHCLFDSDRRYAAAYLLNQVCEIIYGNTFYYMKNQENDFVTEWLTKDMVHHGLSRLVRGYSGGDAKNFGKIVEIHWYLTKRWAEVGKEKDKLYFERIVAALILAGEDYHEERQHKALLELVKANDFSKSQIKEIKSYLKHAMKKHTKKEEARKSFDDRQPDERLEVHGYFPVFNRNK